MNSAARWLARLAAGLVIAGSLDAATVRVTTWNLEWFPNGTPKDAPPAEQEKRIAAAADVLRPLDPDVILLQEVRDYDVCARLGEAIKTKAYQVAICSAFKEPFQPGLGRQQVAILAKEPAQAAWAERWKSLEGVDPPRGFSFGWFKIRGADVGVYSVHLKSNLVMKGDKAVELARNIRKREVATAQLVGHVREVIEAKMPTVKAIVIGGDFNTNLDQSEFAAEKTLATLPQNGFKSCFGELPLAQRITHAKNHGYPDATFDYLFARGARPGKPIIVNTRASDHLPVTCDFMVESTDASAAAPASAFGTVRTLRDVPIRIPYGTTRIPAGTVLKLLCGTPDSVDVEYLGATYTIPRAATTGAAP